MILNDVILVDDLDMQMVSTNIFAVFLGKIVYHFLISLKKP